MNKYLCMMLSALFLTACGGGGSKESPTVVVEPPTSVVKTDEQAMAAVLTDLADKVIIPDYLQFQLRSEEFEGAATQFCSLIPPTQNELVALQQSWLTLNASWQVTRATKLGPVFKQFRYSRLQTWPDNNAAVSRGVATLLATDNLTAQVVADTQDGAQGLPALEYLLFSEPQQSLLNAADKTKRCLAVMAIAANVSLLSTELVAGWQPEKGNFRSEYLAGSGDFVSMKDALEEQLTNWFELVEIITDNKIGEPLGLLAPGTLTNAEQYRSQSSLLNIEQNLLSLQRIYLGEQGYGFDDYLVEIHQAEALDNAIKEAFSAVFTALNEVNTALEVAITSNQGRSQLVTLSNKIKALRTIMASDFVQTTGFNPSFNSNDGD